jgi:hypothetical protein
VLKEMLPRYLAAAILMGSIFPAAIVLQAGIAIDLWIQRMASPRPLMVKVQRAINLAMALGALLFIVAAALAAIRFGSKAVSKPDNMTVPEGYQAAPS